MRLGSLLINGQASLTTSSLALGNHTITAVYSGDANYGSSASQPLTQVIINSDVPGSPQTFYGCRVVNKFINTKEHVNVLTWAPPQNNADIIRYEIYRDAGLTDLAGTAPNHCPYRFEDKAIKKHKIYTYYIVSVNSQEIKSSAISTTVTPKK